MCVYYLGLRTRQIPGSPRKSLVLLCALYCSRAQLRLNSHSSRVIINPLSSFGLKYLNFADKRHKVAESFTRSHSPLNNARNELARLRGPRSISISSQWYYTFQNNTQKLYFYDSHPYMYNSLAFNVECYMNKRYYKAYHKHVRYVYTFVLN